MKSIRAVNATLLTRHLRITSEQGERIIRNAEFVECASVDGRYWFTFIETPEIDMRLAEIEDALCDLSKE